MEQSENEGERFKKMEGQLHQALQSYSKGHGAMSQSYSKGHGCYKRCKEEADIGLLLPSGHLSP